MNPLIFFVLLIGEVTGPEGPDVSPPKPGPPPKIITIALDDDLPVIHVTWCYPRNRQNWNIRNFSDGVINTNKIHFAQGREVERTNFLANLPAPKADAKYAIQAIDFDDTPSEWSEDYKFNVK